MRIDPVAVEEWLARNLNEMIHCPNQPGNLRITKRACLKRYKLAQTKRSDSMLGEDEFAYFRNKGLSVCRDCPTIKIH